MSGCLGRPTFRSTILCRRIKIDPKWEKSAGLMKSCQRSPVRLGRHEAIAARSLQLVYAWTMATEGGRVHTEDAENVQHLGLDWDGVGLLRMKKGNEGEDHKGLNREVGR